MHLRARWSQSGNRNLHPDDSPGTRRAAHGRQRSMPSRHAIGLRVLRAAGGIRLSGQSQGHSSFVLPIKTTTGSFDCAWHSPTNHPSVVPQCTWLPQFLPKRDQQFGYPILSSLPFPPTLNASPDNPMCHANQLWTRRLTTQCFVQTNSERVPHVRTSVRGLIKKGRSPIEGLSFC